MRCSTNTASAMTSRGCKGLVGDVEALKKLRAAGFDTIDFSFVFQNQKDFILHDPNWEKRIEEIGLAAENLGITFNQCHFPYVEMRKPIFKQEGYAEMFFEVTRRAIIAAGMLRIPHGVTHPQSFPEVNHERKACFERNREIFDEFIELGVKCGVRTAIENMPPMLDGRFPLRYGMHYDDVIELVDSYNAPEWVGICWDTGHANLARLDQTRGLHAVGSRLIALHLNDNCGDKNDEHLLPGIGTVDWQAVIQALVDIDYQGDLTYETGRVGKLALAGAMQESLLRATYENAKGLLALYEQTTAISQK